MTKYYRVIKDHPVWEVGAIISNRSDTDHYSAIEDIWDKIEGHGYYEIDSVVEGASDFFQRVYPSKGDKMIFVTAAKLKKAYSNFKE